MVLATVDAGAGSVPGREHRAHRAGELHARIGREVLAGAVAVELFERVRELLEVDGAQLGVELDSAVGLERRDRCFERLRLDPGDDLAVHLDQPAVGVVREVRVPGPLGDRGCELGC